MARLPWTTAVAELISKKWRDATIEEYAAALGAQRQPDHSFILRRSVPDTDGFDTYTFREKSSPTWGRMLFERSGLPGLSEQHFAPHDIYAEMARELLVGTSLGLVAETNIFNELVTQLPFQENAGLCARYRGEFMACLSVERFWSPSLNARLFKEWRRPICQEFFGTAWWTMSRAKASHALFGSVLEGDNMTLGLFDGEWLNRRGKPVNLATLVQPGEILVPHSQEFRKAKINKTMRQLDVDYGRFTAKQPGWWEALRDNEYPWSADVRQRHAAHPWSGDSEQSFAFTLVAFIQKGWL